MELYLTNLIADEETDYSLWKATKQIKRPIMPVPPKGYGDWARKNKQTAGLFAEYLEVFIPNDTQNNKNLEETNIITEGIILSLQKK